jgi:hypothetical protein
LIAEGAGVHWPEIDEDLSARGFFVGTPAPRPGAVLLNEPVACTAIRIAREARLRNSSLAPDLNRPGRRAAL